MMEYLTPLYTIEISIVIAFALLVLFGILGITKKMSMGIAIASAASGFVIAWFASDYNRIIMQPFYNALWYGYDWGWSALLGGIHFATICIMVFIAGRNLYLSDGDIIWA